MAAMEDASYDIKLWITSIARADGSPLLSTERYELLLGMLPEQAAVARFVQQKDRERALVSRIMQRHLVAEVLGVEFSSVDIGRTSLGKPYIKGCSAGKPHNYNVSHDGDLMVLAYSDACLIGVDLVDTHRPRNATQSLPAFLNYFRSQLTDRERMSIASYPNLTAQYTHFYVHWALKEAFVKAVGQGIGYDLLSVEFVIRYTKDNFDDFDDCDKQGKIDVRGRAEMKQHGEVRSDWRFEFWSADDRHIIAVATGPIEDAIDEFRATLGPAGNTLIQAAAVDAPLSAIRTLQIEDMLPSSYLAQWVELR